MERLWCGLSVDYVWEVVGERRRGSAVFWKCSLDARWTVVDCWLGILCVCYCLG